MSVQDRGAGVTDTVRCCPTGANGANQPAARTGPMIYFGAGGGAGVGCAGMLVMVQGYPVDRGLVIAGIEALVRRASKRSRHALRGGSC